MKTARFFTILSLIISLTLWGCRKSNQPTLLKDFRKNIEQLSFSPNGKYIAAGKTNLKIFKDGDLDKSVKTFSNYESKIRDIKFSSDNKYLITATDSLVRVYNVSQNFDLIKKFKGNGFDINTNQKLLAIIQDNKVNIYDLGSGWGLKKELSFTQTPQKLRFSQDYLIVSTKDKIYIFSTSDWKFKRYNLSDTITDIALSSDNKLLAVGFSNMVYIYNLKGQNLKLIRRIREFFEEIKKVGYSPDNKFFFILFNEGLSVYAIEGNKYILKSFLRDKTLKNFVIKDNELITISTQKINFYSLDLNNAKTTYQEYYRLPELNDLETLFTYDKNHRRLFILFLYDTKELKIYSFYHSKFNYNYTLRNVYTYVYFHNKDYLAILNDSTESIEIYKLGYKPELINFIPLTGFIPCTTISCYELKISDDDQYLELRDYFYYRVTIFDISDLHDIYKKENFEPEEECKSNTYKVEHEAGPIIKIYYALDSPMTLIKEYKDFTDIKFDQEEKYFALYKDKEVYIYSTNNFDKPIKTLHFDGYITDIYNSDNLWAVLYSADSNWIAILDERRKFKDIAHILVPNIFDDYEVSIENFASVENGRAIVIFEAHSDEQGHTKYLFRIFYKLKELKLLKSFDNSTENTIITFTNTDNYLTKFESYPQQKAYKLRVFNIETPDKTVKEINESTDTIAKPQVYISEKYNYLAVKPNYHQLIIYQNDRELKKLKEFDDVQLFAFSHNEKYLAVLTTLGELKIYELPKFKLKIRKLIEKNLNAYFCYFSPANKFVIIYNPYKTYIISVKNQGEITVNFFPYLIQNDQILVTIEDNQILFYKITEEGDNSLKLNIIHDYTTDNAIATFIVSHSERYLLAEQYDGKVIVLDLKKNYSEIAQIAELNYDYITFTPNDKYLITTDDGKLKIYSVADKFELYKEYDLSEDKLPIFISPDKKYCFVSTLMLSMDNCQIIKDLHLKIKYILFSPNNKYFIIKTDSGYVLFKN